MPRVPSTQRDRHGYLFTQVLKQPGHSHTALEPRSESGPPPTRRRPPHSQPGSAGLADGTQVYSRQGTTALGCVRATGAVLETGHHKGASSSNPLHTSHSRMHACTHLLPRSFTPTCTLVGIHRHIYTHSLLCKYIHPGMHACTRTRTYKYVLTPTCACTHGCISQLRVHTQVHSATDAHMYTGVHTLTHPCPVSLQGLDTEGKHHRAGSSQGVIYFNY